MLVSVIIPMYNAEKYIERAIESVIAQSFQEWELLIVNDNSNDKSVDICEKYLKQDERIKLIHNTDEKAKHGAFAAKNKGIEYASCKYIYFMDADDYIESDLLKDNIELIEENNADISIFGYIKEVPNGDKTTIWKYHHVLEGVYSRKNIVENIEIFWKNISLTVVNCMFKRNIMGDLLFREICSSEDGSFLIEYLMRSETVVFNKKEYYHYCINNNSLSHKWNVGIIESKYICTDVIKSFFKALDIDPHETNKIITDRIMSFYSGIIYNMCMKDCNYSVKEKYSVLKQVRKNLDIDTYAKLISIKNCSGLEKLKTFFICHKLELILVITGPAFLKFVRGM